MPQNANTNKVLAPGTLVISKTMMPSVLQPWIHPFYVGTVEAAGTDPAKWNGYNSEQDYCNTTKTARVRYESDIAYDLPEDLIVITPEQAALSHRDKIALFLGEEALGHFDRCSGTQDTQ